MLAAAGIVIPEGLQANGADIYGGTWFETGAEMLNGGTLNYFAVPWGVINNPLPLAAVTGIEVVLMGAVERFRYTSHYMLILRNVCACPVKLHVYMLSRFDPHETFTFETLRLYWHASFRSFAWHWHLHISYACCITWGMNGSIQLWTCCVVLFLTFLTIVMLLHMTRLNALQAAREGPQGLLPRSG